MKRKYKHEFVTKIWHLFCWRQCCACTDEFRREQGWSTQYSFNASPYGEIDLYLCKSCAPTKLEAENEFQKFVNKGIKRYIPPKEE